MNYKKNCDINPIVSFIIFAPFCLVIGNMTLYNIKVQPFVKRAKGDWGEGSNNFKIIFFRLKF